MKCKNIKEVGDGFRKKYKILQKLVYVSISMNISSNLCRIVWSPVTNEFNHHHHKHISYIYYTLCSLTGLTLTFEWVLAKLVYRAY